ncbi:MAG: hypothetical protein O7A65_08205, partial [Proteobacteria bacterium]|nr:hypothetical protein [Pseudomonadota bacterium]
AESILIRSIWRRTASSSGLAVVFMSPGRSVCPPIDEIERGGHSVSTIHVTYRLGLLVKIY